MWIAVLTISAALIVYWELSICEGAHLGRRAVVAMYDLTASRYNQIKEYDPDWEQRFLGEPVAHVLGTLEGSRLLDVGAGTGRLAWALEASGRFEGTFVGLEASRRMIQSQLHTDGRVRTRWVQAWATPLPFAENTFDLVSSLEVLEFTPAPRETLRELARVLRPGGWLLVTNRVGWQAPLILGRTFSTDHFQEILGGLGLSDIEVFPWQEDYDLAWARKPITPQKEGRRENTALS